MNVILKEIIENVEYISLFSLSIVIAFLFVVFVLKFYMDNKYKKTANCVCIFNNSGLIIASFVPLLIVALTDSVCFAMSSFVFATMLHYMQNDDCEKKFLVHLLGDLMFIFSGIMFYYADPNLKSFGFIATGAFDKNLMIMIANWSIFFGVVTKFFSSIYLNDMDLNKLMLEKISIKQASLNNIKENKGKNIILNYILQLLTFASILLLLTRLQNVISFHGSVKSAYLILGLFVVLLSIVLVFREKRISISLEMLSPFLFGLVVCFLQLKLFYLIVPIFLLLSISLFLMLVTMFLTLPLSKELSFNDVEISLLKTVATENGFLATVIFVEIILVFVSAVMALLSLKTVTPLSDAKVLWGPGATFSIGAFAIVSFAVKMIFSLTDGFKNNFFKNNFEKKNNAGLLLTLITAHLLFLIFIAYALFNYTSDLIRSSNIMARGMEAAVQRSVLVPLLMVFLVTMTSVSTLFYLKDKKVAVNLFEYIYKMHLETDWKNNFLKLFFDRVHQTAVLAKTFFYRLELYISDINNTVFDRLKKPKNAIDNITLPAFNFVAVMLFLLPIVIMLLYSI